MISMSHATAVYRHNYTVTRAPEPAQSRCRRRIDWAGMREQAARGVVPDPGRIGRARKELLSVIRGAVKSGDIDALEAIHIGEYNSVTRALTRYREICVIALRAQEI